MTAAPNTDELWPEVGIDPVRVALPGELVGYTLRAYRLASQVTPTEAVKAAEEDDPFAARERARAEEDAAMLADLSDTAVDEHDTRTDVEEPELADFADEEAPADEEIPIFLSHRGRLLLFATGESLVEFVRSSDRHDMRQLDTWDTLVKRIQPADAAPADEDTYELDLVVENLRGGPEVWDLPLLISAAEFARDLGHALRLEPVINAMSPGSPLDDLDEALRAAEAGGVGGMLARRRLHRIGAQQTSLGWRTVIGKISDAIDWRG